MLVLYAGDSRFSLLREQAGVKVDYCNLSPNEKTFTLAAYPDRPIYAWDKTTCKLLPGEAEVIGKTAAGEPVFTKFSYGKGTVLLCNAPIDRQTIGRADALTGKWVQPYYLVFREAAKIAGLKHVVEKSDCPWVGITEHPAKDGATIVMAINFEPRAIECPVKISGKVGRVWRGDVKEGRIALEANEAALFEVVR